MAVAARTIDDTLGRLSQRVAVKVGKLHHHHHHHCRRRRRRSRHHRWIDVQVKPEDVPLNLRGEGVTTHTMRLTWDQPIRWLWWWLSLFWWWWLSWWWLYWWLSWWWWWQHKTCPSRELSLLLFGDYPTQWAAQWNDNENSNYNNYQFLMVQPLNDDNGDQLILLWIGQTCVNFPNSVMFCLVDGELDVDGSLLRE